jgi:hypothetical protein
VSVNATVLVTVALASTLPKETVAGESVSVHAVLAGFTVIVTLDGLGLRPAEFWTVSEKLSAVALVTIGAVNVAIATL